jgi:hypothetical protein
MPSLRIAPSWGSAVVRTLWVLAACAVISLGVYAINGAPSQARAREDRNGGPFGPTMPFGLVQFLGQTAILAAGVYVGRRWLRLKL